jgi:hypothetical protein
MNLYVKDSQLFAFEFLLLGHQKVRTKEIAVPCNCNLQVPSCISYFFIWYLFVTDILIRIEMNNGISW